MVQAAKAKFYCHNDEKLRLFADNATKDSITGDISEITSFNKHPSVSNSFSLSSEFPDSTSRGKLNEFIT